MAQNISFDIIARDKASRTFDKVASSSSKSQSKLAAFGRAGRMAGTLAAAGAAVAGVAAIKLGSSSLRAASDMNESLSKAGVVFGKNSQQVLDWSKTSATAFGASRKDALEASATIGNLLLSMGKTPKAAADMSTGLVGLAADLGSFNNVPTAEVLSAIQSGLTGEIAPLRRFGVNLTDATLKAKALEMGLYSGTGALDTNAKSSAAYALILEQTKTAQGDFARTSDGLANQQKILGAQFDNLKTTMGQKLLPVAVKLMNWMTSTGVPALAKVGRVIESDVMPAFRSVGDFIQNRVIPAFRGIGEGSGRTSAALSQFRANFSSVWISVQSILASVSGFAQAFWGRFGDLITKFGIGTLKNFITQLRGFANIVAGIFKTLAAVMKGDWSGAWAGIKQIARGATQVIGAQVSQLWNLIRTLFAAGGRAISSLMRAGWSAAVGAARAGVRSAVSVISNLPSRIVAALGDLYGLMYRAAGRLMAGLANGIRDKIGDAINAVKDGLSKIKGLLPGSPIKAGPLKSWNNGGAGRRLMDMLALGLEDTRSVDRAMGRVAKNIAGFGASAAVDVQAHMPAQSSIAAGRSARMASAADSSAGGSVVVNINFSGQVSDPRAAAEEIRKMLVQLKRTNGGRALGLA